MTMLTLIIALSTVMWYLLERGKTEIWGKYSFGKWITIGCAAVMSALLTFSFNIDIIYALELVGNITIAGKILTALILMSGSSAVAELINSLSKRDK